MKIKILIPGRYRINGMNRDCKVGETLECTHREGHALAVLADYAQEIKPVRKVKRVEKKRTRNNE